MTPSAPFRRGPFEELPESPRIAHPYFETAVREDDLETAALGRVRIHTRTFGSGPPLLLVHGLMTSSYSFRHVLAMLGASYSLFIPDLPGAGRSGHASGPLAADALAELLVALVDRLGIRGCPAVGNSMGGYLSVRAALRDEGVFSALVDVHSPGIPEARLWALAAALSTRAGCALTEALVARDPRRWVHRNVHYRDESLKSLEEAREYGGPLETREGRAAFVSYLRDTLDPRAMRDFVADLSARRAADRAFPIPLCLVYSTEDPMVPPRIGRQLSALIPSAELHWMEESSHFAHVDTPERFVAIAESFLRRSNLHARGATDTQGLARS